LRKEYGQELPKPPDLPSTILTKGLETMGFVVGGPGKIGALAAAPVKALGKRLTYKVLGGAIEAGTAMGFVVEPTRKKQVQEAAVGVVLGAAFPLGMAGLEKFTPVLVKILTGTIPPSQTRIAMENPELVLNNKALAQEGKEAGKMYEKFVKPLIEKKTLIDRKPFIEGLISKDIITKDLEISPTFETQSLSKLSPAKQARVIDWIERITGQRTILSGQTVTGPGGKEMSRAEWSYLMEKGQQSMSKEDLAKMMPQKTIIEAKDMTFKDAMKIRNEISPYLEGMWKKQTGNMYESAVEKSTMEGIGSNLRGIVAKSVKAFNKDVGTAIERYANYETALKANKYFQGYNLAFFKTILPRIALATLGMPMRIATIASLPLSIPKSWSWIIRGASAIGRIPPTAYIGAGLNPEQVQHLATHGVYQTIKMRKGE
jgi:hypothetical protein